MIPLALAGALKAGRPFVPYILGALLVLLAVLWFRHQLNEADAAGYKRASDEFAIELRNAADQGRKAVEDARALAAADAKTEREERERQELHARELHAEALKAAEQSITQWQKRYQRALATDQSCAAWAAEPVQCPY